MSRHYPGARRRQQAHLAVLRAALRGEALPIPPDLQPTTESSYDDLRRQVEWYRRLFQRLKACTDRRCSLCARCVEVVWREADRKPRKDLIVGGVDRPRGVPQTRR